METESERDDRLPMVRCYHSLSELLNELNESTAAMFAFEGKRVTQLRDRAHQRHSVSFQSVDVIACIALRLRMNANLLRFASIVQR